MTDKKESLSPKKRTTFEDWMNGDHVLIHLDSRREGVEVPVSLRENPSLTLKLSYNFAGQTSVDEKGIAAYLKFAGTYEKCVVPWEAIWGMTASSNQNAFWPEDLPKELVVVFAKEKIKEIAGKLLGRNTQPQSNVSLHQLAEPEKTASQKPAKKTSARKSKRTMPQLKRIK